ncbi:helix-turn-helix domain-containing protein [Streptomyces sp. NPDC014779]|uniref:helix-turn-helix domain-containing protein n=1 Tax=unclassified Streptomyces TaxID=2593676 RepID=UPI0036FDFED1
MVGNHLAQHPTLSGLAIGLGVHIQSLPDGADTSVKRLTLRFREGEISIRRALNELAEAGYLERRRVALGGGRFATRVIWYDRPRGAVQAPGPEPEPEAEPEPVPPPEAPPAPPPPPASGPAVETLVRLRAVDSRLLLSRRDVERLAPAVDAWFAAGVDAAQVTRTLVAGLPPEHVPIHHPARFLAYRLDAFLPPPLPPLPEAAPAPPTPPPPPKPLPMVNCDGCDRGFRSSDPDALCRDCRRRAASAAA